MPELTTAEKAKTLGESIAAFGATAGAFAGLAGPQYAVIAAAMTAILKEAPTLFVDFVEMFSGVKASEEAKADFNRKLAVLSDPEKAFQDPPLLA